MNENQPSNSFDPSRPVPPYGPSYPGRPAFDAPDGHSTPPPPFMGATPNSGHRQGQYSGAAPGQAPHDGRPGAGPAPAFPGAPAFIPPPPPELKPRRFDNQQIVAMLLAAAGVVVTLVGVVLLLVMAAREGILTPPVRVVGGAAGSAALAAAASWVRRRPGGQIGSIALLATAASAAYFDVIAVTRLYAWVPLSVGLAMAFVVAAAAFLLAMRWDEKWLAIAIMVAVCVFAPFLTQGPGLALVAFLFVIQLVGVAPELTRRWDELGLARTVPVVLAATFWIDLDHSVQVPVMIGLIALTAVTTTLLTATVRPDARWGAAAYFSAWLPMWVFMIRADRSTWTLLALGATLVAALTWWALRHAGRELRLGALVVTVINALTLAFAMTTGPWLALPFLAAALVLFAAQGMTRQRIDGQLALGALGLAAVAQQVASPTIDLFYRWRAAELPAAVAVSGLLMLTVAAVATWSVRGRTMPAPHVQMTLVGAGFIGLLGFAMSLITCLGRTPSGFFLVHLVITVGAMALAALVLVAGLTRPRHLSASMTWGLALLGCALLKLLMFDLAYMGAMTRAMTCVVAGLVLLAAGTTYARTYALASKEAKQPKASSEPRQERHV